MTSRSIRVLLVEDDEDDYLLMQEWLAETADPPFLLERVPTHDAGLEAMRRNRHDVYLVDYHLGKRNGLDLIRETLGEGCKGPVILLTGQGDRDVDIEAMKAGAVDYLPKTQLSGFSLERAIRYAIERSQTADSLRQSQKMEAVGRLAGGVAHDFNNLLTVINGCSELLLARPLVDGESRELAEEILKAGKRAANLTQQLLVFGRKHLSTFKALNLNVVVADLGAMLRRLIGEDVELALALSPSPCGVKADPSQIEQIIVNLAVNARDAMPRGGRLTIETSILSLEAAPPWARFKVQPGRYVLLSVRDTGSGMTDDVKSHLFEPFFSTKGVGKGTGLGLATLYGAVKQNNGYVIVQSEVDRGSTFHVYLPLIDAPLFAAPTTSSGGAQTPSGSGVVLLVEDEASVRHLVRTVLQQSGYEVLEAANGVEAVRLCEQRHGPIHLLVTDVVMPQMGGRELVERLAPAQPGMKVLYISGYTEDAVVRHGVSEAETAFLQKPFSVKTLADKVSEVLRQGAVLPQPFGPGRNR